MGAACPSLPLTLMACPAVLLHTPHTEVRLQVMEPPIFRHLLHPHIRRPCRRPCSRLCSARVLGVEAPRGQVPLTECQVRTRFPPQCAARLLPDTLAGLAVSTDIRALLP